MADISSSLKTELLSGLSSDTRKTTVLTIDPEMTAFHFTLATSARSLSPQPFWAVPGVAFFLYSHWLSLGFSEL